MKIITMFGTLNDIEMEDLIHRQVTGRIGCHAEGTTYVVPISYAYDGESVFGHTFEGMKLKMMRTNPEVCFQVDDMHNMANWQSVIAWGAFEELPPGPDRSYAVKILSKRILPLVHSETMHLTPQWPFLPNDMEDIPGVIFRIRLAKKTGRFEKTGVASFFAT